MSTLYNSKSVKLYHEQLDMAKAEIREICNDHTVDSFRHGQVGTVVRYNYARDQVKEKYDSQVIFLLDSSGFVHEVLSASEKAYLKSRNQ